MTKENRAKFETELNDHLRVLSKQIIGGKALKNKITLLGKADGCASGLIELSYLSNANGYMLAAAAKNSAFSEFYETNPPPYKSNLPSEWQFSMNSLMEEYKIFATQIGGTVPLPTSKEDIIKTCDWIVEKISSIYLERVKNIIGCTPNLIGDIIKNPKYYDFPIPMIACVIKTNRLSPNDYKDSVLTRALIKNKNYDSAILLSM